MKARKLSTILAAFLAVVTISACNPSTEPTTNPSVGDTSETTTSVPSTESTSTVDPNVKTNEDFEKARISYTDANGNEFPLTRNTLYTNSGDPHLDSTQPQRVLVIPFGFGNGKYDETPERLEKINKVFFGTDEEMEELGAWTSVASYYSRSSYNKAKFEGKVIPTWVIWNGTEQAACNGVTAAEYGVNWYRTEYAKENHGALGADAEPLSYFDANNDGFIDLTWVVYSHPTTNTGEWWAYVTYTSNKAGATDNPNVKTLGFASIDWMDKKYQGYDSHTYIHETGHTFGLDDYYDYNSYWSPFGKVDMMDSNLGDHNAYSKFSLGWVQPWIVDDSAEITLRSTTLTGDCFVLPSTNYNGTAFDEYLMVEFCTPEGLNEADYKNANEGIVGFNKPGVRVSHVDARVYGKSGRDTYLIDNPEEGYDIRIGNSKGGRIGIKVDGDYWPTAQGSKEGKNMAHLTIIESSFDRSKNPLNDSGYTATNSSLFKEGERLNFTGAWAEVFMPSGTNLWNKAKSITSWTKDGNKDAQNFTIDTTMTIDYSLRVLSIEKVDGEYIAKIRVTKSA